MTPNMHIIKCDKKFQVFWYMCAEGIVETDGLKRWGTIREGFPEEGSLEQKPEEAVLQNGTVGNIGNTPAKENEVKKKKKSLGYLG